MVYLNLEELHHWLLNCKVSHFNIETMEVNTTDAFLYIVSQFPLADGVEHDIVRQSTSLVELSEELVYFKSSVVEYKLLPECGDWACSTLLFADDLLEIPGEAENISVLLL
jgi:hypothetical protein